MTIKDDILGAVGTAQAAAQILHDVANGPESGAGSTVATASGSVASVAKAVADIQADAAAQVGDISEARDVSVAAAASAGGSANTAATQAGLAGTAKTAAEAARDVAITKRDEASAFSVSAGNAKTAAEAARDVAITKRDEASAFSVAAGNAKTAAEAARDTVLAITVAPPGLFYKADADSVAFSKTGAGTISLKAGTKVEVAGSLVAFAAATAVVMPALTAGTDYAVYACGDGTVRADANFTAPTGYTAANSRKIGGFHYAPGNLNVDATPNINAYSMWDLRWRPNCADPRGMALVSGAFWCDIYFLGITPTTDGTSRYGVSIARGGALPKIPLAFGGDGSAAYAQFTWYEAAESMAAYGKKLLSYDEFAAAAYGVTENASGSTGNTTARVAGVTSKWGIEQVVGCKYCYGRDFGGPYGTAAYTTNTFFRGSTYNQPNAVLLGHYASDAANTGSRAAYWANPPSSVAANYAARGCCGHLRMF